MTNAVLNVLVVGAGDIGMSHIRAYIKSANFKIIGIVDQAEVELPEILKTVPVHQDFEVALNALKPDLVCICTYSNSHSEYAKLALNAGAHVFVEEPWALSIKEAQEVLNTAEKNQCKLITGHILSYDPIWNRFVVEARNLGGPYVIRITANQQADSQKWQLHKKLMQSAPPIVDSGIHFAYIMSKITEAKPIKVNAIGLRLSDEINPKVYNYGQMQVTFSDDSIAWFEAGWGPMMSNASKLLRDVVCPAGSVSVLYDELSNATHHDNSKATSAIVVRHAKPSLKNNNQYDWDSFHETRLPFHGKMSQDKLCEREQNFVYEVISKSIDLSEHHRDSLQALDICLAAHKSVSTGKSVNLG